jgi:hypothetical protein
MSWVVKKKGQPDKYVENCNKHFHKYKDVVCDRPMEHTGAHRFEWKNESDIDVGIGRP